MSIIDYFVCGGVAGFANGFLASQLNISVLDCKPKPETQKNFNGPLDCAKRFTKQTELKVFTKG